MTWKGAGSAIGEGLGLMVNSFVSRQDQLRAQALQEEQQRQAVEQQRLQNERQAQQLAMQQQQVEQQGQQYQDQRSDLQYTRERQGRLDGINVREGELKDVLAPTMNTFMTGVQADLARYAPTLKDGRANPQYNPALFSAAQDREKQARKLWSQVGLGVGHGENWEQAKGAFLAFTGGEAPAAAPQGPAPVAPPPINLQFPPPNVGSDMPRGELRGQAETGGMPAPPAAPPQAAPLPPRVQDIPPSQLADMSDDQLAAHYGPGGLEYAQAARTEYAARVLAGQQAAAKVRSDSWDIQLKELAKRTDLTPQQRLALTTITTLTGQPTLAEGEPEQLAAAFNLLAPKMYTAESWQKVLDTKDPLVILAQLPTYQQQAPDVVAGFNAEPLRVAAQAGIDKTVSEATENYASAGESGARTTDLGSQTDARNAKLPGEIAQQGATLADTLAQTTGREATTDYTRAQAERERVATTGQRLENTGTAVETKGKAFDIGVKRLAQIAGTGATAYQLQQTPTWFELKQALGVNDATLTALLQDARYQYGLGVKGKELELQLTGSKILTDGAQRGKLIADTGMTLEQIKTEIGSRDVKIAEIQGRIALAKTQGRNYDSMIEERDRLVGERETLLTAQGNAANASAANSRASANQTTQLTPVKVAQGWANVAKVQTDIKNDRERTGAYITSVKGRYAVDMAQIEKIRSDTLLNRAKNPNDPLYNPVIAAAKPGDPITALTKRAGVFYSQADQNLKQAQTLQSQINAIMTANKPQFGEFNPEKLKPEERTKLEGLKAERDRLFSRAQGFRQQGDDTLSAGMEKLPANITKTDPYGTTDLGGVRAVTVFPATSPPPKSFNGPARAAVSATAGRLGIDANALAAVISFETAGSFNPAIKNSKPGQTASGLIQFTEATAKRMGTTTAALRAMPFATQMQYVERYLQGRGIGPGSDIGDIYAAVTGSGYKRGSPEYDNNQVWDADGNGVIDKGEQVLSPKFQAHVRDYFAGQRPSGPQAPGSAPTAAAPGPQAAAPQAAAPKANTGQLEAGLKAAVINKDGSALNTYGAQLVAAGYSQAQVMALIKKYQGGS